jgi:cytochrome P450
MSENDYTERSPGEWDPDELLTADAQRDPYPWFAQMREQGPVHYDETRNAYDVFGYDETVEMLTDWERFSRHKTSFIGGSLMDRDPPEHTELRGMAADWFQAGAIREYRPTLEEMTEELLDDALSGDDEFDFVEQVAKPLPIMIIADMMGIPKHKMDSFRKWSEDLTASPASVEGVQTEAEGRQRRMNAAESLLSFFDSEIEKREENPQDDLITMMVKAQEQTELVDRSQIKANCSMLLAAGNITTTTFMTNAIWTYIEEDVIPELKTGTIDLVAANEEVLRYRSPVTAMHRRSHEDTELGGVSIPKGVKVTSYINSANRDESVFEAPDEFRPGREPPKEPIPYGKGIHYCLGAPLANMEAEVVLGEFLERIEDAELLTDDWEPLVSTSVFGPAELPIRVAV